jgi:RimJ/RimL family protein N-acetyltransferase
MELVKTEPSKVEEPEVKFEFERGNFVLAPYSPAAGTDAEETLISVYFRIKKEGLESIVFHENPDMSLFQFAAFMSSPRTCLQIFAIKDERGIVDTCGIAWLADIQNCAGILVKAVGSFCFWRTYQSAAYTDTFGSMVLDYWFNVLKLDTLVGLTPSLNRPADVYAKRVGLLEVARIPAYTTYDGKVCDGIVHQMTRDKYVAKSVQ